MSVRDFAYILDGVVVNVCRSTPENVALYPFPYDAAIDITDRVPKPGPGWTYDGAAFSPPPPPPAPDPNAISPSDDGTNKAIDRETAVTITVPAGLGPSFFCRIVQTGPGPVTLTPDSGVQLHSESGSFTSAGQWAAMTLTAVGSDVLVVGGSTATLGA